MKYQQLVDDCAKARSSVDGAMRRWRLDDTTALVLRFAPGGFYPFSWDGYTEPKWEIEHNPTVDVLLGDPHKLLGPGLVKMLEVANMPSRSLLRMASLKDAVRLWMSNELDELPPSDADEPIRAESLRTTHPDLYRRMQEMLPGQPTEMAQYGAGLVRA